MTTPPTDVYTNPQDETWPGAKERSRPGTGPREEVFDKVLDASGRTVSAKPANKAFLRSKANREAHRRLVEADRLRRSTQPGSPSPSQSLFSVRSIILILIFLPLFSQFLTSTWSFDLSRRFLPPLRRIYRTTPYNPFRKRLRELTPRQLKRYDGSDPWEPVYIAIDGVVYDVSRNKRVYGKGGSYNMMAGRDASRSFITGCFETHLTHDLRGLSAEQLKALDSWKAFFANHDKYKLIGKVHNPPIDPDSPIPPPCHSTGTDEIQHGNAGRGGGARDGQFGPVPHAPGEAAAQRGVVKPAPVRARNEL